MFIGNYYKEIFTFEDDFKFSRVVLYTSVNVF